MVGRKVAVFEIARSSRKNARGEKLWFWKLKSPAGRTMASSGEGYLSRSGARNGIDSVKKYASTAEVSRNDHRGAG